MARVFMVLRSKASSSAVATWPAMEVSASTKVETIVEGERVETKVAETNVVASGPVGVWPSFLPTY